MSRPLGRVEPADFEHVEKYPLTAPAQAFSVNFNIPLPYYHWEWDQGQEGQCVGYGSAMVAAVRNTYERTKARQKPYTRRYDPRWLYAECKKIDGYPGEGTYVRSAMDVMRDQGLVRWDGRHSFQPSAAEGIAANRWATTVDEIRSCIARRQPVSIGVNWYTNFDAPKKNSSGEFWIGHDDLGSIRGGHCICIYGASDRRQAFRLKNSWGRSYPLVWLPYETVQRLLNEHGEATVITDR